MHQPGTGSAHRHLGVQLLDGLDRARPSSPPAPAWPRRRCADVAGSPGQPEPVAPANRTARRYADGPASQEHCACAAKSRAERPSPLLDSAPIPHDEQQARPALLDSVRRADGRRGQRHLDRRVSMACVAAQRLCARRVDRGDGRDTAVACGHPDRGRRGGLPRAQARFDDLRCVVRVVGGGRACAGADVRRGRHQRRGAGHARRLSAPSSIRQA